MTPAPSILKSWTELLNHDALTPKPQRVGQGYIDTRQCSQKYVTSNQLYYQSFLSLSKTRLPDAAGYFRCVTSHDLAVFPDPDAWSLIFDA